MLVLLISDLVYFFVTILSIFQGYKAAGGRYHHSRFSLPSVKYARSNMFGASTDKLSVWEAEWNKGNTSFHLPEVNPKLLDNLDILLDPEPAASESGRKNVLVPLCGKTKDLVHLHSLGHNVIGVEWVEMAADQFFSENNIGFSEEPLEGVDGSVYTVSSPAMSQSSNFSNLSLSSPLMGGYECSNVISFS